MAQPSSPSPVKYICGMISARKDLLEQALTPLVELLGPADIVTDIMDFDFTHYYDAQMGSPLYRRFVAFANLDTPERLAAIKQATNQIEEQFAQRQGPGTRDQGPETTQSGQSPVTLATPRPINLDPGYLESAKLVLASMKNFSHRIYLSGGVYAEVTLMYHKGRWDSLPWTFPDYASGRYHPFLTQARDRLREQLEQKERS